MTLDLAAARGSCLKKSRYSTEGLAERVAAKAKKARGVELRVYYCPTCYGYHLTKMAEVPRG